MLALHLLKFPRVQNSTYPMQALAQTEKPLEITFPPETIAKRDSASWFFQKKENVIPEKHEHRFIRFKNRENCFRTQNDANCNTFRSTFNAINKIVQLPHQIITLIHFNSYTLSVLCSCRMLVRRDRDRQNSPSGPHRVGSLMQEFWQFPKWRNVPPLSPFRQIPLLTIPSTMSTGG